MSVDEHLKQMRCLVQLKISLGVQFYHWFMGALSRHFSCFPAETIQKSFSLTFAAAENIIVKFMTKTSINFLPEELSIVHFLRPLFSSLVMYYNEFQTKEGQI